MPRKQVSRRRRGRKPVDYDFAEAPPGEVTADVDDDSAEDEDVQAAPGADYVRNVASGGRAERHVSRDYTHVRNEVVRIAIIGGALIIAIIVAGFFR